MRIEGIETLAAQVTFLEMTGLSQHIRAGALEDNKGRRYLKMNNYRGVDLHEITKALRVGQNKKLILRLLRRSDLIEILHLLPKALLVQALRFFSKEKLLRLFMMLPKRMLMAMLLMVMSIEELVKKMPSRELFSILRSQKLTNREMIKGFHYMPMQFLMQILMKMFGNQYSNALKHSEIMRILLDTEKHRILEGMKMLPFKALAPFVNFFVQKDPRLLECISKAFIFKMMSLMPKPVLLQAAMALPEDMIIKFLCQLPDQFLMLAAAQLDDATLEGYLMSQHSDLLMALGGVAA